MVTDLGRVRRRDVVKEAVRVWELGIAVPPPALVDADLARLEGGLPGARPLHAGLPLPLLGYDLGPRVVLLALLLVQLLPLHIAEANGGMKGEQRDKGSGR